MYIIANGIGIVLLIILLTIAIIVKIVSGGERKLEKFVALVGMIIFVLVMGKVLKIVPYIC